MEYKIKCNGTGGGEYYYLHISTDGKISLKKKLEDGSSFIISKDERNAITIFAQNTTYYLGWDLASASPKAYPGFTNETLWHSNILFGVSPLRAYTSQKKMYLDGVTTTGLVRIVDTLAGGYTGTRWDSDPDLGFLVF